jgi:hypothetical protein
MNKNLRHFINCHSHQAGNQFGLKLRAELLAKATTMAKAGKSQDEIIFALGIKTPADSLKTAQEAE